MELLPLSGKLPDMHDWAIQLKSKYPDVARRIDISNLSRDERLDWLELPRYKSQSCSVEDFMQQPERYFETLDTERYWVNLSPTENEADNRRYSEYGLTQAEATAFVISNISPAMAREYQLTLFEFFNNIISGNVVIDPAGRFLMEAVDGDHTPFVRGARTPEYNAERDVFTRFFKYSQRVDGEWVELNDEMLRASLYSVIEKIPHWGYGRDMEFMPGYYEFTLVGRNQDAAPEPIFFDYLSNSIYYLPDNAQK